MGSTLTTWSATPDAPANDFNGDGRTDPGIVRPGVMPEALWYSPPSGGGGPFQIFFGTSGDIPVAGDYDGDGKTDAVIFRPSTGLWIGPRTGAAQLVIQLVLGQDGDIPVPCDYDGDGAVDPAIYRPSTGWWFGSRTNGAILVVDTNLGLAAGDIPVPADFNGDGTCDPTIMRPGVGPGGTGLWFSWPSGGNEPFQIYFGEAGDLPVPGDYDGDGKADAVIFRPSTGLWYGPRTGAAEIVTQSILGQNGDIPIPGDYDGNGATDLAIYRPSTGLFYGTNAAGGTVVLDTNLGVALGDIPTGQRWYYQAFYPYSVTSRRAPHALPSMSDGASMTAGSAHAITQSMESALAQQGRPVGVAAATPASNSGFADVIYVMIDPSTGATHCLVDDRWIAAEADVPTQWTVHWELVTLAALPAATADQLVPPSWATCQALLAGAILK